MVDPIEIMKRPAPYASGHENAPSAAQLRAVPGSFTGSRFVASVTGVDNVCERAALYGGGRLLVQKQALGGVTVAVAEEPWEVRFG